VKAVLDEGEKGLAMRLLVQGAGTIRGSDRWPASRIFIEPLDFRRDVEIALGAQEIAVAQSPA
jgi:hypothetical protein